MTEITETELRKWLREYRKLARKKIELKKLVSDTPMVIKVRKRFAGWNYAYAKRIWSGGWTYQLNFDSATLKAGNEHEVKNTLLHEMAHALHMSLEYTFSHSMESNINKMYPETILILHGKLYQGDHGLGWEMFFRKLSDAVGFNANIRKTSNYSDMNLYKKLKLEEMPKHLRNKWEKGITHPIFEGKTKLNFRTNDSPKRISILKIYCLVGENRLIHKIESVLKI